MMSRRGEALHERLVRPQSAARSSDRAFGFVFAGFFAVLAGISLLRHGSNWPWFLGAGIAFAVVALVRPGLLKPLNWAWAAFGAALHKVVSPIVMIVIFFGVVTPLGILMRLLDQRPLDLQTRGSAPTYWKRRTKDDQTANAMTRQF